MAVMEAGFYDHMMDQTAFTALVGTRLYPLVLPQDIGTKPAATYQRLPRNEQRLETLAGSIGLVTAHLGITLYSTTYATAKSVTEAVRNEIEGFTGTWDTNTIIQCSQLDEYDGFMAAAETGFLNNLFTVSLVYEVVYTESVPTL